MWKTFKTQKICKQSVCKKSAGELHFRRIFFAYIALIWWEKGGGAIIVPHGNVSFIAELSFSCRKWECSLKNSLKRGNAVWDCVSTCWHTEIQFPAAPQFFVPQMKFSSRKSLKRKNVVGHGTSLVCRLLLHSFIPTKCGWRRQWLLRSFRERRLKWQRVLEYRGTNREAVPLLPLET